MNLSIASGPWGSRNTMALVAGSILLLLLFVWWWGHSNSVDGVYRTSLVDRGSIRVVIAATGNLKAVSTVDVGSQLSGQVKTVEGDFNQHVKKNQAIAHIDPANFQARLAQANADLASAQANLVAAKALREQAQATLASNERDLKRKQEIRARGLIAISDVDAAELARDQTRAQLNSAQAAIAVAQANIQQKQAVLDSARLDLEHTVILAPVDGVITSRNVQPGQTVAASFQTPVLFSIAEDLGEMELDLNIDEADVGQVKQDQPVRFTVDAYAGREYQGQVQQIRLAAQTTQNVVTYPVVVLVKNPDFSLLPGMTANAEVEVGGREDALRLPNAVLRFRPPTDAQAAAPRPESAGEGKGNQGENLKALVEKLKLTPEQQSLFEETLVQMRQKRAAARAQSSGETGIPSDQARAKSRDAFTAALAPLRQTLSDAQKAILDAELAEQAKTRRAVVWRLGGGKLVSVPVRLGLSDGDYTEIVAGGLQVGDSVVTGLERSSK